ncbi:MAG: sugar-binding protein, partial [Victivallaceae bacterium]|nr:sugar-binding protein [Victivallaceae bacterium]
DKLLTCIGDRFRYDCFIFHIHRAAPEYPDLDSDYQSVFKVLAKHGYKDTPIFSPEGMHWKPYRMPGLFEVDWIGVPWGPLSYDMGHEERLTAAWRARTWLVGLKNADRVKQMNSSTNFWSFEMDFALTPFANQKISNTLGRLLGNADFVKEVRFSGKTRCYLFVDAEKRPVVALWSCDPDVDRGIKAGPTLRFEKPYPQMSLFDLMEVEWSFGGETKLTPFPVFLRGEPGSLAAVESALGNAELSGDGTPAANASFELKAPADYRLTLNNSGKHAFRGKVNMGGIATQVELRPGETKSIPGKLPAELTDTRVNFESIGAEVTQTMPRPGHYLLKEEFAGVMSNRADIKVDGDISDWAQIPELPIDQRRYTVSGDNLKRHQQTGAIAATLKLAWNNGTLYMLIDVTDPVHKLNPRTRLVDGWRSDSVQVFFDSFADGRRADAPGLGVDDWEYGVYVDPVSVKPYVYRHHVPDAQLTLGVFAPKAETVSDDVECAFVKTDKGYRYELGFKERALMPFKAGAGKMLGVGVLLNNQNTDAPMPQERLFWGIAPELPNARPDLWPVVVLKK